MSDESRENNNCSQCKEGIILGEKVYCGVDGRFHPLSDELECKRYLGKKLEQTKMQILLDRNFGQKLFEYCREMC